MEQIKLGIDEEGDGFSLDSIFPVFGIFFDFSLTKVCLIVEIVEEVDFSEELGLLTSDCCIFCFPGVLRRPGVVGFEKNFENVDFIIFSKILKFVGGRKSKLVVDGWF